jgi:hypothetical protein
MVRIIITLFLILYFSQINHAQCILDAGEDVVICQNDLFTDTIHLNPILTNVDTPLQSVVWEYFYQVPNSTTGLTFWSSIFLNDTSALNPYFTSAPPENDFYIKLIVTDNSGNVCQDSVRIFYSSAVYCLADCIYSIQQGACLPGLFTCVMTVFPAETEWTPHLPCPETSTSYSATITDSVGCVYYSGCMVYVLPSSVSSLSQSNINVYPNPVTESLYIDSERNLQSIQAVMLDVSGKTVLSQTVNKNRVDVSSLPKGVYHLMLYEQEKLLGSEQIVKN